VQRHGHAAVAGPLDQRRDLHEAALGLVIVGGAQHPAQAVELAQRLVRDPGDGGLLGVRRLGRDGVQRARDPVVELERDLRLLLGLVEP
jgi:hypothetical protein